MRNSFKKSNFKHITQIFIIESSKYIKGKAKKMILLIIYFDHFLESCSIIILQKEIL